MTADRREPCRPTWVEAGCLLRGKLRRALLTSVSSRTCRVHMAFSGIRPGDRVVLALSELLMLPATVVWVHGAEAGLEFASPMMGAMLGEYVRRVGKAEL